MEKVLWIIFASALRAAVSRPARSYHFIDELKTWTEAQSFCRENYADLATVEDMEDVKVLKDTAQSLGKTYSAWIGLFNDVDSWRWSTSDSNLDPNHEDKFRNWRAGEPNNTFGREACGEMGSDGSWDDEDCSQSLRPVCIHVKESSVTFVLVNTSMNWTEAQTYCREHHTDLARIRNQTENQMVKDLVPAVWMGLYRDTWKWTNGSSSSFRYWSSGEPGNGTENCASANFGDSGKWEKWMCDTKKTFICYSALCAASSLKYQFIDELKTWTEAQSFCRENYTDLATIEDMEDVTSLNNMTASLGKNLQAWIGLYEDVSSWKWSVSDSNFYQYDENTFRNWRAGGPDNSRGQETCTEMFSSGSWNDESCSLSKTSICFNVTGPNVTLVYINTFMNWTEAQSYCREHHTDLVSVRNQAENQMVTDLIPAGQGVWIGLYRDTWKWSDGSSSSFSNWNSGQPNNGNENCVAAYLRNSGKWEDWPCDTKMSFICYSALCSASSLPARDYHFVDELKTWTEAQSFCRENYADLATIEDMKEVTTVNDTAARLGKNYFAWIGLYNDVNSWRWSFSDPAFYQRFKTKFKNWSAGEPNNGKGAESCGAMVSDGSWYDMPCSKSQHFSCIHLKDQSRSVVFYNLLKNWTEAQTFCRTKHTDLSWVTDQSKNWAIKSLTPEQVWIGLFRDSWKWTDGNNSSFQFWTSGKPDNHNLNENCAAANFGNSGKWDDWQCNEKKAFVCHTNLVSKRVVKLKLLKASVDLNHAAVLTQLQQQLIQKLKDQGVKADIKLSWKKQPDGNIFRKKDQNKNEL